MAQLTDSLKSAISRARGFLPFGGEGPIHSAFTHQIALAAYMASGMMKKVISIPAQDRTQKWRDWQAEKEAIAAIEAEEKRLALCAKVKEAEVLRGVGGGALILITAGDHAEELKPQTVGTGGLVAINVVSRWQLTLKDWDRDLASPTYGQPKMFAVQSNGREQPIHPSRVICFRGEPLPAGGTLTDEEAFWGDSRLLRVFREVERSDHAQEWFAALLRKAKLLRIGIPDLLDLTATEEGQSQLDARIALIAAGESTLNATVYRSGTSADDPGEKIDDYQVTWTGIPAMMDAFDQRVAAVSDIPFTRLTGRSPAGLNATGEHDQDNWRDAVTAGQENETRPCLERIDPVLLRSAGVTDPEVWWTWAPLDTPEEREKAETFKVLMEAVDKLLTTGLVPEEALSKAVQNLIEERGDLPGLADALAEISEDERFAPFGEDDPSSIQEGGDPESRARGGPIGSDPSRRAANDGRFLADAAPRSLYVSRKVINADEIIRWAKAQGVDTTLPAADLHVTVAFSRKPVDWFDVGSDWSGDETGKLHVRPGGPRAIERLGDGDAVVLLFQDDHLEWRHKRILEVGASWDWPEYRPHITLSYSSEVDIETVEPYTGPIVLGPELFAEVDDDWKSKIEEA